MAERNRLHVLVRSSARVEPYSSYQSGRGTRRPPPPLDRKLHSQELVSAAGAAVAAGLDLRREAETVVGVAPSSTGVYITFDSVPGFELALATFDPSNIDRPPELVAVQKVQSRAGPVERATVFVPDGSIGHFIQRFEEYAAAETPSGNARHGDFVERIARLRLATIEALWTDPPSQFPGRDEPIWWEVWLRRSDGHERERMADFAVVTRTTLGERFLVFDNRIIVLIRATGRQLANAIDLIGDIAELRRAK